MTKLAAAQAEILELRVRLAAREEALRAHEDELVQLRAQIAWLKKQLFGSKSERLDRRQLELMLEGLEEREWAKDDMGVVRRERATDPDGSCIK